MNGFVFTRNYIVNNNKGNNIVIN